MNFGKWIFFSFVVFAVFIGSLVTICVRQDISLVSKDYYKEELAYQEQLARMNNTLALENQPEVKVIGDGTVEIQFAQLADLEKGRLQLFCPSNSRQDKTFELIPTKSTSMKFEVPDAQRGMYKAKMYWTMKGKEYYSESIINL